MNQSVRQRRRGRDKGSAGPSGLEAAPPSGEVWRRQAEHLSERIEELIAALVETTMRADGCDRTHAICAVYARGLISISHACDLTGMNRWRMEEYLWQHFRELYPFNQDDVEGEGD